VTAVSQDLRYLKPSPRRSALTRALEALADAGPFHAVPVLAFAAALGVEWRKRRSLADPAGARARAALRAAQARLREARAGGGDSAAKLGEALAGYLADKAGQSPSGLTLRRAQEIVRARSSGADGLLAELKELWDEVDMRRFAPAAPGGGGAALEDRLEAFLKKLDSEVFR
jgi:hypothetical protein